MPKISKDSKNEKKKRRNKIEQDKAALKYSMYKSAVTTYILLFLCLAISFVFNGELLGFWNERINPSEGSPSAVFNVLDILIRSSSVILFFWFALISVGNWRELRGYILTWREMTVIVIVSLLQTTINGTVFLISMLGICIILIYMYFIQGKIESELEF